MKKDKDLENKSILELKSFKYSLIITAIISIIASGIIIHSNNLYYLCEDITCMKEFPIYFNIPFKIIAAGVTFAGFLAVIHRSEQTRLQIQFALEQSSFKNFIDHRSEFYKVISEVEHDYENIKVRNKTLFYKEIFPNNTPSNVEITAKLCNPNPRKNTDNFKFEKNNKKVKDIEADDESAFDFDFNFYYEDIYLERGDLRGIYLVFIRLYNDNDERYETQLIKWIGSLIYCAERLNIHSKKNIKMPKEWAEYLNNESPWSINFREMPSDIINFAEAYYQQSMNILSYCFPSADQYLNEGWLPQPKDKDVNTIIKDLTEKCLSH
jgi:hypothetical protein